MFTCLIVANMLFSTLFLGCKMIDFFGNKTPKHTINPTLDFVNFDIPNRSHARYSEYERLRDSKAIEKVLEEFRDDKTSKLLEIKHNEGE